jgi:hypothetical protein
MVTGWHPCGSSGVLRLLPGPVPGGPVTGTLDGKVAAAAAETLELIQWVADCVNNAGAARLASLEDQPFAEIPAPRPVTG